MKSVVLGVVLALSASASLSQESESKQEGPQAKKVEMPIFCMNADSAEKIIQQQKESAVFVAIDKIHQVENLTVNIFRNEHSGTYTIAFLALDKNMVCVLSAGENAKFIYNY